MPNGIATKTSDYLKTLTAVAAKLVEFKAFYIAVMLGGLLYLIANAATINASTEQVYAYALISLLGIAWASATGINLEALNWRAAKLWNGRIIKSPQKVYTILWSFVLAAIFTAAIIQYTQGISLDVSLGSAGRRSVALQQLFIITLPETVIFQGILPLIIIHWLFPETSIVDKAGIVSPGINATRAQWAIVYVMSQTGFALMHNFVYGGDILEMVLVGSLGAVWLYVYRHMGAGAAWGSHFGWNTAILGLITIGGI